jgi:hypothetical protein
VQRTQEEGRVADPRIAGVPVALPAGGLWQRGGERRDGRPRRQVCEAPPPWPLPSLTTVLLPAAA